MERNQATDIYSFAIVCSEVINLQPAWQLVNKERSATGELEKIRKTCRKLFRYHYEGKKTRPKTISADLRTRRTWP